LAAGWKSGARIGCLSQDGSSRRAAPTPPQRGIPTWREQCEGGAGNDNSNGNGNGSSQWPSLRPCSPYHIDISIVEVRENERPIAIPSHGRNHGDAQHFQKKNESYLR